MNAVNMGGFTYGDDDSTLILTVKDSDGTVKNFTGATVIRLLCKALDGSASFTITGAIYGTATNGQLSFSGLATGGTRPNPGRRTAYMARAYWTDSGASAASYARTDFRFWVEDFS